jgi:hypothetical protein
VSNCRWTTSRGLPMRSGRLPSSRRTSLRSWVRHRSQSGCPRR